MLLNTKITPLRLEYTLYSYFTSEVQFDASLTVARLAVWECSDYWDHTLVHLSSSEGPNSYSYKRIKTS